MNYVSVGGLRPFPDFPYYARISKDPHHYPYAGFYGTSDMVEQLQGLALMFRLLQTDPEFAEAAKKRGLDPNCSQTQSCLKLSFNDMSLPLGGLFDIHGDWHCPHKLHRKGRSVDLNRCLPKDSDGPCLQITPEIERWLDRAACCLGLTRIEKGLIHYELKGGTPCAPCG